MFKNVTDIDQSTHWQALASDNGLGITKGRIYRLFEMYDSFIDDTDYWICSDNGHKATMGYLTVKGNLLSDGGAMPTFTEKHFFTMDKEEKKRYFIPL